MICTELIAPVAVLLRRHAAARPDRSALEDARGSLGCAALERAPLLPACKVPQMVHLVDTMARTGPGKIMRFKLRGQLAAAGGTA